MAQAHFPPHSNFDLLGFFSPVNVSSESRARAFLWLCYHYYESTSPNLNPFGDQYSRRHPGQVPNLKYLSPEEVKLENTDTLEEKEWGLRMKKRRQILVGDGDNSAEIDAGVAKISRRKTDTSQKQRPLAGTSKFIKKRSPVDKASSSISKLNQDQLSEGKFCMTRQVIG